MKQIKIKSIKLTNFKGIKSLTIPFSNLTTEIHGDNATGKTTIVDAFNWCLFGKDSQDRKDFAIKPHDAQGNVDNKVESEVVVELIVENTPYVFRRVFVGNFVKKRGSNVEEFSGNETKYFIDDVPHKQKEYDGRIAQIVDEQLFKLLSIPGRFSALDWKQQREILYKLADIGTDVELIQQSELKTKYQKLIDVLLANKTLDMYKKQIGAQKLSIKKELEDIRPRIVELRSFGATEATENNQANKDIIQKQIDDINALMRSSNQKFSETQKEVNEKISNFSKQISDLQIKKSQLQAKATQEANKGLYEWTLKVDKTKNNIVSNQNRAKHISEIVAQLETKRLNLEQDRQRLVGEWNYEKALTFESKQYEPGVCPCCHRANEATQEAEQAFNDNQQKALEQFEANKIKSLKTIEQQGEKVKQTIDATIAEINELSAELPTMKQEIENFKAQVEALEANKPQVQNVQVDTSEIDEEIETLRALIAEAESTRNAEPSFANELSQLQELNAELDAIKAHEAKAQEREKVKARIAELEAREQSLCIDLANNERDEYLIDEFTAEKIDIVQSKVNSLFSIVKFKMFNNLINDGVEETCEATVDGVTISNVNNAGRINAGLDIINVLSNHYAISAPCFIDNAESITKFIQFDSQLILLIVNKEFQTLKF